MKIENLFCGFVCLCLLSGCSGQLQQGTESDKPENITTSRIESLSTPAVAEEHTSPEKAIEQYCQASTEKNMEDLMKIVPPDYHSYLDSNSNGENGFVTGRLGMFNIRVTDFKNNIALEKGEEMYEWYLNYYTAIRSTNAEKVTLYTTSVVVSDSAEKEQTVDIQFFCVLEDGKWYAIIAD